MANNEDKLHLVQERVATLETQILGDQRDEPVKIADTLLAVHNKLQSFVTGREKITSVYAKLDELEKYLDPEFTDNLMLTDGAKMHLIFCVEDKIRKTVDSLQTIKDMEQYIDSERIKTTPTFMSKLQQITKAELQLIDNVYAFDQETKKLAEDYNTLIESISQQFVLWDSMLCQLEEEERMLSELEKGEEKLTQLEKEEEKLTELEEVDEETDIEALTR